MAEFAEKDLLRLEALHQQIDGLASSLAATLGSRLVCRKGCSDCCSDGLTVLEIEAELITARNPELVAEGLPGPQGKCAFLDQNGACRVYDQRPYICRTQGLPLRWFNDETENSENRDICPLNLEAMKGLGETMADISPENCWTIGPWEGRLASLQAEASGQFELVRVPLRSLFHRNSPE